MRRCAAMWLIGLGACTPAPGLEALSIEVSSSVTSVELGLPFRVEVVRTFPRSFEPAPFEPSSLAPLEAQLVSEARRTLRGRVAETFELEARAFALETVTVPGLELRARPTDGGAERSVRGDPLRWTVRSALAGAALREAELPGGLLPEHAAIVKPFPIGVLVGALGLAALLTLAAVGFARRTARRTHDAGKPAHSQTNDPRERAVRRLRELVHDDAFHIEVAVLVREFLAEAFDVPAPQRSTEEVLGDARIAATSRATLQPLLEACDAVKFAAHRADRQERAQLARDVEAWLRDTPGVEPR